MKNVINTLLLAIFIITLSVFDAYASGNGGATTPPPPPPPTPLEVAREGLKYAYVQRVNNITPDGELLAQVNQLQPTTTMLALKTPSNILTRPNAFTGDNRPDSPIIIPWGQLLKGDILFMRDIPDTLSIGAVMNKISGLTHAGIVYDSMFHLTFEAWAQRGVDVYDTRYAYENSSVWRKAIAVRIKRVYGSAPYTAQQIDAALTAYHWIPFFPTDPVPTSLADTYSVGIWAGKWINKNDMSSMYCSKLVWNTYMNFLFVDLDAIPQVTPTAATPINLRSGASFLGVTPDDLYWSGATYTPVAWGRGNIFQ